MGINLQNKNILVTREERQAKEFSSQIKQFGGNPYIAPLLKVSCVVDSNHMKILESIQQYEWIFFTSANGVRCFFNMWNRCFGSQKLVHQKFAVVGIKTNEVLRKYGYEAAFIPSTYNAETMTIEFLEKYNPNRPVLLVRGKLASQTLPNEFTKVDVDYDCLLVYETLINYDSGQLLNHILHYNHVDYITFTSPSTIDAFFALIENIRLIEGKKIVCIGTTTKQRGIEKGLRNILVPKDFTIEGMITTISDHIDKKG